MLTAIRSPFVYNLPPGARSKATASRPFVNYLAAERHLVRLASRLRRTTLPPTVPLVECVFKMAEGPSVLGDIIDLWPRLQVYEHLPTSEYDKGLVLLRLALIWCIRCVFELYIHTTVVTLFHFNKISSV